LVGLHSQKAVLQFLYDQELPAQGIGAAVHGEQSRWNPQRLEDLNAPGFDFHGLQGKPKRSIHVNGPWCITFEWIEADAWRVDLEQHH
jgi:hypothetical protein